MPAMRHPYANPDGFGWSHSTEVFDSWLQLSPAEELAPQQSRLAPYGYRTGHFHSSPPSDRTSEESRRVVTHMPPDSFEGSPGHYVKHSGSATLLLTGQEEGRPVPEYTTGATVEGILVVARPSSLLAFQVRVEGRMLLDEVGGSGVLSSQLVDDLAFEWDADRHATFPSKVTFRYTLPTHYTHHLTGERFRLPSSYSMHLDGVPGLNIDISYAVAVYLTQTRSRANWWRKSTRLRVPFIYRELTRPALAGPFGTVFTKSPTVPRTVFQYTARSLRRSCDNIRVELYLPHGQICSLCEPIPFSVTFFASEEILSKYASFQPPPGSFHPFTTPDEGPNSAKGQLFGRIVSPVRLELHRRTQVDVLAANQQAGPARMSKARADLVATETLATGVTHDAQRSVHSVVWTGHVLVPSRVGCGGFVAKGIRVTDHLVLTLAHPAPMRSEYAEFYQSVPVRLTTDTHDCSPGVVSISGWSDP